MEKQNGSANGSAKLAKQKETVKKIFSAFETGNTSGLEDIVDSNFKENMPHPSINSTGIQLLKDQIKQFNTAFPDLKMQIKEIFGDGEKICVYTAVTGTNKGSFMGHQATNKKVTVDGIDILKFTNDKVTEHWGIYDNATMLSQLGLIPSMEELVSSEVHK